MAICSARCAQTVPVGLNLFRLKLKPFYIYILTQPSDPLLRRRKEEKANFPNQPFYAARFHHCRALSLPLEDLIIFQMDQTASPDQGLLWDLGECRKN